MQHMLTKGVFCWNNIVIFVLDITYYQWLLSTDDIAMDIFVASMYVIASFVTAILSKLVWLSNGCSTSRMLFQFLGQMLCTISVTEIPDYRYNIKCNTS